MILKAFGNFLMILEAFDIFKVLKFSLRKLLKFLYGNFIMILEFSNSGSIWQVMKVSWNVFRGFRYFENDIRNPILIIFEVSDIF